MIVADLDGCMFDNMQRKELIPAGEHNAVNWTSFCQACTGDTPLYDVINLVKHLHIGSGEDLVFLTSRTITAEKETLSQLREHFREFNFEVLMRQIDDERSPAEYKKSQLEKLSDRFTSSSIIIDDHEGVISMVAKHFPQLNRMLVPSFDCTVVRS